MEAQLSTHDNFGLHKRIEIQLSEANEMMKGPYACIPVIVRLGSIPHCLYEWRMKSISAFILENYKTGSLS